MVQASVLRLPVVIDEAANIRLTCRIQTSVAPHCSWVLISDALLVIRQDLPRSPVAPPLDSCFLRPARPAHRRPPSRWAAHSPSSSPRWSDGARKRFTFPPPPPAHSKTAAVEQEEAGLPEHSPP
ncbi:hypothetical protein N1851_019514 [Merluccius polli]|uniref:Uncharacterized protein n=1 Tax=Merluccius polli TaxID=89951 RepID=A0AA47MLH9_MERPO|nr:hypothetical protein N1851_019514 [Merluccius polli]